MIEYRSTDKVSKAQNARETSGSLFQPTTHSTPLPNRRPVSGEESKTILTQEELDALPKFRGEEQPPVEKCAGLENHWAVMGEDERRQERMQKAGSVLGTVTETLDTGDGVVRGYSSGASTWIRKGDSLAGDGFKVLERQHREQNPVAP